MSQIASKVKSMHKDHETDGAGVADGNSTAADVVARVRAAGNIAPVANRLEDTVAVRV